MKAQEAVKLAWQHHTIVPAFNIPYLPMAKPVAQAIIDEKTVAMLQVARLEWEKFESRSLEAVAEEYFKYYDPKYTLLHLDHVPVIDEDHKRVDFMPILERAVKAGYQSVMVDGSRLSLEENIATTKQVAEFAHANGIACEAELGSVMGHEGSGANMDYEEIFRTKKGFTDLNEAKRFAAETGCDWLSVAVGSIHGAIADGVRNQKKPEARLDIQHIADLSKITGIPLVLHGGSGINNQCILDGIANGIAKINVGTEIRQTYERTLAETGDVEKARAAVFLVVVIGRGHVAVGREKAAVLPAEDEAGDIRAAVGGDGKFQPLAVADLQQAHAVALAALQPDLLHAEQLGFVSVIRALIHVSSPFMPGQCPRQLWSFYTRIAGNSYLD